VRTSRTILDMLWALRRLRWQETWTRRKIDDHQSRALAKLRAHAYAHSPFYREFHAGMANMRLEELPILTKSMLHDHFNDIVTDPCVDHAAVASHVQSLGGDDRFLGRYMVNASSGTAGTASYILYNRAEWAIVLASFSRFERHIGSFWGTVRRPKLAVVASATPWHMSARIGATVHSSWLPMLRLDVGEPLEMIVRQLNAYQPQVLATYASMAGILADEQRSGHLRIAPQRIVSAAEVLSPALRQRAQDVWGDIVFDQYGATEGGTFAVECQTHYPLASGEKEHRRGLHLFEDLYLFEVVDRQNRPIPVGEQGEKVLLTVLFNHSLPLIRYELTDSVRMSRLPCPCGCAFALIDSIEGRTENVLRFSHRNGGVVRVHPMTFYRILDALPLKAWQIIQERERLCICLSGDADQIHEEGLVNTVADALARLNVEGTEIKVKWVPDVARGTTGKAARIVQGTSFRT
jgi:phenylacetate-CoA ligase